MNNPRLKRLIVVSTPFAIFLLAGLLWMQVIKPAVITFVKSQIPKVNSMQNVVLVEIGDIDISLLKLQLIAKDLTLSLIEKNEILPKPIVVKTATAQLDIFNLIIGQLNISKVTLDKAYIEAHVKKDPKTTELPDIPVDLIFSKAGLVPVDHIIITRSELKLYLEEIDSVASIKLQKSSISNMKSEVWLIVNKLSAELSDQTSTTQSELSFSLSATKNLLKLKDFEITLLNSYVKANADFTNYSKLLTSPTGNLQFNSHVNLEDVRNMALKLFPQKKRVPAISGVIKAAGKLALKGFDDVSGQATISTSQVALDHFKLGQAELATTISKNQILINEIHLEHPSGNLKLKDIRIEQKAPYHFNSGVEASSFDLYKFFQSVDLATVPAGLKADGTAQCEGLLEPSPMVTCEVKTDLQDIWVKTDVKDSFHIVKLKKATVNGEVKITKDDLTYQANIQLGATSTGSSSGKVEFKEGFEFEYETANLDFKDVESLAGLDIKGNAKIVGSALGDSSHGVINATLSAANAEIENFRLGNFKSNLEYKEGQLAFSSLGVVVGKSELTGNLNFDFLKSQMNADITSTNVRGEDIFFILNKKFDLPFEVTGSGKASTTLSGPIDFWKLSYDLNAELSQGTIAGERFEKLILDLNADGSQIDFTKVILKKAKSVLTVGGQINTESKDPVFNLKLKADPFQLEESDHLIKYAPAISGLGYSEGTVTGPLSSPTLLADVTLKQITYDKVEYSNSQGQLKIDKKFFNFNGQFFGRQIQTDVSWPWNENDSFYAKVLIRDLNPLFLLPLLSIPQPSSDFYSRVNAEIDLSSRSKSISNADGFIRISEFLLQRGNQALRLTKPSSLYFKSGLSQMDDFDLRGDDSFLRVRMDKNTTSRLKLNVESDLQLRMFHFLVPFAQSLSGNLMVNSQILFKDNGFELFGEGEITDGAVGIKGFPQTIDNINAPIEFSKSKIILSDITAQLGPSDISGVGHIDILGAQNIVVNLRAIADNVQLVFPEKIYTQGKANLLFTGNWLPYNLKIDYKVSQGLIENDFEPDPKQSTALKASSYLPPQQVQLLSSSLTIDANIDMTNGILIKNKILEGEAKGNLQVQGSPEQPILIGKITVEPGSKLIFKDKPFEIQNSVVQFQGTKEINPDIYISANSRVSEYDISLLVQGPAKNMTITPTSQPPLSQNDIFTLLALGVTNQGNQALSSDTQQRQTGLEVLAAISNQSQLNKKIQERLGLTVQLAPSVDSTKNIAVPKVVVSKKLSKKVNASYSKPFTGNDQNQEVKLQYLYNNNVSFQLNYQNKDAAQQEQITNTPTINKSILGLDLEFRDEFK